MPGAFEGGRDNTSMLAGGLYLREASPDAALGCCAAGSIAGPIQLNQFLICVP